MVGDNHGNGGSVKSFFTSLPGILTGIAGVLTAVVAIGGLFIVNRDSRAPAPVPTPPTTPGGTGSTVPGNGGANSATKGGSAGGTNSGSSAGAAKGKASAGGAGDGTGGSAAAEGFRVIEKSVRADPFSGAVACPVDIQFSGRISVVGGSGVVTYRWIRSDGASAPVETVNFDAAGSQEVNTTWTRSGAPGADITGWQAIQIFEPREQESAHADFNLSCS